MPSVPPAFVGCRRWFNSSSISRMSNYHPATRVSKFLLGGVYKQKGNWQLGTRPIKKYSPLMVGRWVEMRQLFLAEHM
jgi:hypothetical protein